MSTLKSAINLVAGNVDRVVTGKSDYGTYAFLQMTYKPARGRIEIIDVRFPDNYDVSGIREGDAWQFVVDVRPRREGDRVVGIARYVVSEGELAKLNRKLAANELPGFSAPPKAA